MFGIGGTEFAIIALFAFILFGPDKLPEIARTVGKAMRTFKRAQEDMERVIRAEVYTSGSTTPAGTGVADKPASDDAEPASAASGIWASAEADIEEEEEE